MITEIKQQANTIYYIAHNGKDIFHYCVLEKGMAVITGQPNLEKITAKETWKSRGVSLGIKEDMEKAVTGKISEISKEIIDEPIIGEK